MWDRGFVNPPVAVTAQGSSFSVTALNARGNVLVPAIHASLSGLDAIEKLGHCTETKLISFSGTTKVSASRFPEEQRSRQPSVFSVVRAIIGSFFEDSEGICGLYGAFSYDLAFQFEKVKMKHERPTDQRDIVLYVVVGVWYLLYTHRITSGTFRTRWSRPTRINLSAFGMTSSFPSTIRVPRDFLVMAHSSNSKARRLLNVLAITNQESTQTKSGLHVKSSTKAISLRLCYHKLSTDLARPHHPNYSGGCAREILHLTASSFRLVMTSGS